MLLDDAQGSQDATHLDLALPPVEALVAAARLAVDPVLVLEQVGTDLRRLWANPSAETLLAGADVPAAIDADLLKRALSGSDGDGRFAEATIPGPGGTSV